MLAAVTSLGEADYADLGALIAHSSLAREFELLQGPSGLENALRDPLCPPEAQVVARNDGDAVGVGFAFVAPGDPPWAMVRIGVIDSHRRLGIGSRLLAEVVDRVLGAFPRVEELCLSAWQPCEAAAALAARHGYREVRRFWLMERPHGAVPEPAWPEGIETRTYDGSAAALTDLAAIYNDSFSRHYHYFPATAEEVGGMTKLPRFEPDGVLLAYRDGACVGFCRCETMPARGEIASLGVSHGARGIGIGRALLRWGTQWLERRRAPVVTLVVDGENEGALRLYRSEGYTVSRTRPIWSKPAAGR